MALPVGAVVTSTERTQTFSPSSSTTRFTIDFDFNAKSQITVTKTTVATGISVTLTQGVDYTVRLPVGSTSGWIDTSVGVTSTHTLTVERNTPKTQPTSFTTQGSYLPKSHEDAFDRCVYMVQELSVGSIIAEDVADAIADHEGQADPHDGYALLEGRSGGQHLKGGTASGEDLQISSTDHATKGSVLLGSGGTELVVDDVNNRVGVGTATPAQPLHVVGAILSDGTLNLYLSGDDGLFSESSTAPLSLLAYDTGLASTPTRLLLYPESHATKPSDISLAADKFWFHDTDLVDANALAWLDGTRLTLLAASTLSGGSSSGDDLVIESTSDATKGDVTIAGTLGVYETSGEVGIGTSSPGATLDVRGQVIGQRYVVHPGATFSVNGSTQCNAVFFLTDTGAITATLPALSADVEGCLVTFVDTTASGTNQINISPDSADSIYGTCTHSGADVELSGTADKDAQLTAANANKGDRITLVANNTTNAGWYVVECAGVWQSEP